VDLKESNDPPFPLSSAHRPPIAINQQKFRQRSDRQLVANFYASVPSEPLIELIEDTPPARPLHEMPEFLGGPKIQPQQRRMIRYVCRTKTEPLADPSVPHSLFRYNNHVF
jgi:hypothetical protein